MTTKSNLMNCCISGVEIVFGLFDGITNISKTFPLIIVKTLGSRYKNWWEPWTTNTLLFLGIQFLRGDFGPKLRIFMEIQTSKKVFLLANHKANALVKRYLASGLRKGHFNRACYSFVVYKANNLSIRQEKDKTVSFRKEMTSWFI